MKYILIALISLSFISCASHERNPASQNNAQEGITAESYNFLR